MKEFGEFISTLLVCTLNLLSLGLAVIWVVLGDFNYGIYSFMIFVSACLYEIVVELKKLNDKK